MEKEEIVACLRDEYYLRGVRVGFLPLGADGKSAVYRAVAADGAAYFVKLRRGDFDEASVALPRYLSEQGIDQVMAPLGTRAGRLWASLDRFTMIVYPFVVGRNGYEVDMSARHWHELGTALKRVHTAVLPPALADSIQRETCSSQGRETVRTLLARPDDYALDDPVAVELFALLETRHDQILDLVDQAERLARALREADPEFVLCHSDIHAGNVLIDADGPLFIVDWDDPIFAPKERDLMFIGGGQGFRGHTAREEEALFYQGYGRTRVDPVALAYYRHERIVQDIATFCAEIILTRDRDEDRAQSLRYLASSFVPGGVLEIARARTRRSF